MRKQTNYEVNVQPSHQQQTTDAIASLLQNEYDEPASDLYIEAALAKAGLIHVLESTGVLPTVNNPNPHDPVADAVQHDHWWHENSEEATEFQRSIRDRTAALRRIYVGALVAGPAKFFE